MTQCKLIQTEKTYDVKVNNQYYTATIFFDNISNEYWVEAYDDDGELDIQVSDILLLRLPLLEHFAICLN